MIALLQRVTEASVEVNGQGVAKIGKGLLVLLGVEKNDEQAHMQRLVDRVLHYRVFPDAEGRMNLNVMQASGEVLMVPQFTLAADTRSGNRPGFSTAAPPERAEQLFVESVAAMNARYPEVQQGQFGAHMQVRLVNDGPVTFCLQVS